MREPRYRAPLVPSARPGVATGSWEFRRGCGADDSSGTGVAHSAAAVEPKACGSQVSSLPFTTVDNRTLIALAAAALVFPVLLQPLVRRTRQ